MRDEKCKYCEGNEMEAIIQEDKNCLGLFLSYPDELTIYGQDKQGWDCSHTIKIKYCPMCGRKL